MLVRTRSGDLFLRLLNLFSKLLSDPRAYVILKRLDDSPQETVNCRHMDEWGVANISPDLFFCHFCIGNTRNSLSAPLQNGPTCLHEVIQCFNERRRLTG